VGGTVPREDRAFRRKSGVEMRKRGCGRKTLPTYSGVFGMSNIVQLGGERGGDLLFLYGKKTGRLTSNLRIANLVCYGDAHRDGELAGTNNYRGGMVAWNGFRTSTSSICGGEISTGDLKDKTGGTTIGNVDAINYLHSNSKLASGEEGFRKCQKENPVSSSRETGKYRLNIQSIPGEGTFHPRD